MNAIPDPLFRDVVETVHNALVLTSDSDSKAKVDLFRFDKELKEEKEAYYKRFLFSDSKHSPPLLVEGTPAQYSETLLMMDMRSSITHLTNARA